MIKLYKHLRGHIKYLCLGSNIGKKYPLTEKVLVIIIQVLRYGQNIKNVRKRKTVKCLCIFQIYKQAFEKILVD